MWNKRKKILEIGEDKLGRKKRFFESMKNYRNEINGNKGKFLRKMFKNYRFYCNNKNCVKAYNCGRFILKYKHCPIIYFNNVITHDENDCKHHVKIEIEELSDDLYNKMSC